MQKRYQILLIDSDAVNYHHRLIATLGDCNIILEADRQKACSFFFRHHVDLVIIEHSEDEPAIELLRVLRFVAPSVPVIILAQNGSEEVAVSMFRNGASDYVKKPFPLDELKERIVAVLQRRPRGSPTSHNALTKALHYINSNYPLPLRQETVARHAGVSVSSLARLFKKGLGVTFNVYLNKVRLARAIEMMQGSPDYTITEVAFACGFTNPYHFTRIFRKMMRCCPREFKCSLKRGT